MADRASRTDMTDRPAIKPLEWEDIHYNRSNEEPIPELTGWYAETEVGSYYVMLEGRIEVTLDGFQFHKVGSFDEPEAAFEAAQSDFASRIRSCLLDKPEAVEGEDEIGLHEQALRDAVEPFLDWLDQREEGAHIKEVREGLIGVEDVIPDDLVVLGAHPRAQKDQGVLTIGHFRRLRDVYDGNATPADTDAAQSGKAAEGDAIDMQRVADALESCDWSNCSIGNKEILKAAVKALRGNRDD
jgi:hypothetical protein